MSDKRDCGVEPVELLDHTVEVGESGAVLDVRQAVRPDDHPYLLIYAGLHVWMACEEKDSC